MEATAGSNARAARAVIVLVALACAACAPAEGSRRVPRSPPGRAAPEVTSARILFIGHSLIGVVMPAMMQGIAESLGARMAWDAQIGIGAALEVNWKDPDSADGVDARDVLPTGAYDVVVMTEAVRLDDMIRYRDPPRYGGLFYDLARRSRPDVRVFFFETWHDRDEVRRTVGPRQVATWRAYLDEDRPRWEGIVDAIEAAHPGPPIHIVPGGQAFARLHDAIHAGEVPGLTDDAALFRDSVHPSPLGCYFVALVQFATVFRRSPVGATNLGRDREGQVLVEVPPATARALQRIAWEAVRAYPRSGVRLVEGTKDGVAEEARPRRVSPRLISVPPRLPAEDRAEDDL